MQTQNREQRLFVFMSRDLSSFNIQRLADLLKIRKHTRGLTLFLGSRTGGLFRNPALYNNLQKFSLRDFSLLDDFKKFAECFHLLCRSEDFSETDVHNFLKTALRDIMVTYTDQFVADLLKQGIFDIVITTCIDDNLELALNSIGQRESFDFSVHIPRQAQPVQDQSMQLEPRNNESINIWKVFGDIPSLSYNVNKRISQVKDHSNLQKALEETQTRDLLMVGFDPVWDGDILTSLFPRPESSNSLWYVNDQPPEEDPQLIRFLKNCHAKYISGVEGNPRNFFQELHLQMAGKFPVPYHDRIEPDFLLEFRQMKNDVEILRHEMLEIKHLLQRETGRQASTDEK